MEQIISKIFDTLDDWRQLPAYQLERRADIFFGIYLEEILNAKFDDNVSHVIPEFPIRRGRLEIDTSVTSPNKSVKIDYFAKSGKINKVYFVELKTDSASTREAQDKYLEQVKDIKLKDLLEDIILLKKASRAKGKYDHLLEKLRKAGLIDNNGIILLPDCAIEIVYILPKSDDKKLNAITFDDIVKCLTHIEDPLTKRFLESLNKWGEQTQSKIFV